MEKQSETLVTLRLYETEQTGACCYYGTELLSISVYLTTERLIPKQHVVLTFNDYVLEMSGFQMAYTPENLRRINILLTSITTIIAERFKLNAEC